MAKAVTFPDDVLAEIHAAANAQDRMAQVAHLELAIFYLQTSRQAPDDREKARSLVESAVLSRIVRSRMGHVDVDLRGRPSNPAWWH